MLFVFHVPHECGLSTRKRALAVFAIWYLTSFFKPILELEYFFFAGFFSAFLRCFSMLSLLSLSDSELVVLLLFIAAPAARFMTNDYPF